MVHVDLKHRPSASGVGFVVSVFGQVLTSDRMVAGCRETRTADKRSLSVVATDETHHLALLKLPTATPDAAILKTGGDPGLGDRVAVLGFPLPGQLAADAIMTSGRVAALDAGSPPGNFIELSIPLPPTDGGSPVLDGSGRIVGMATEAIAGKSDAARPANGSTGPDDHSLAVTGTVMRAFLEANHVIYRTAAPRGAPAVFDAANRPRAYILRLECFK